MFLGNVVRCSTAQVVAASLLKQPCSRTIFVDLAAIDSQTSNQLQSHQRHKALRKQPHTHLQTSSIHLPADEKLRIIKYYTANITFHANRGDTNALHGIIQKLQSGEIPPSNTLISQLVASLHAHKDHHGVNQVLHFVTNPNQHHTTHTNKPFDRVVYNALIAHFAGERDRVTVHKLLALMREQKVEPDIYTYNSLLKIPVKERNLEGFERVMQQLQANHIEPNIVTHNQHLSLLLALGKRDELERKLVQMKETGVSGNLETFHIIMKHYARRGRWKDVSNLITKMKAGGIEPNVRTYNILFKYAVIQHQWTKCGEIWEKIRETGPSNISYALRLRQIAELSGGNSPQTAEVLKEMETRGFVTSTQVYSTLIKIAHDEGDPDECQRLFDAMKEKKLTLDSTAFHFVISAWLVKNQKDKAMAVFRELRAPKNSHLLTFQTYDSLLKHLWICGHEQDVKDVYADMKKRDIKPTSDGSGVILAMHAKQNNRQKYNEQYNYMMERQLINHKAYTIAKPYLSKEQQQKFEADIESISRKRQSNGLNERARPYTERAVKLEAANDIQGVRKLLDEMDKKAISVPYTVISALVKMLLAAQQLEEAFEIFEQLPTRNMFPELPLYDLIIKTAAGTHAKRCEAIFAAMENNCVKPNFSILHTMLQLRIQEDNLQGALALYKRLSKLGGTITSQAFHELIRMCYFRNDFTNVTRLISDMHKLQVTPISSSAIYNAALTLAAQLRNTIKCVELLNIMKRSSIFINDQVLQILKDISTSQTHDIALRQAIDSFPVGQVSQEEYTFIALKKQELPTHTKSPALLNQMLEVAVQCGAFNKLQDILEDMEVLQVPVNQKLAYASILVQLVKRGDVRACILVLRHLQQVEIMLEDSVVNELWALPDSIQNPLFKNVLISYTELKYDREIIKQATKGNLERCLSLYDVMTANQLQLSTQGYDTLLRACVEQQDVFNASRLLRAMDAQQVPVARPVYNLLLLLAVKLANLPMCLELLNSCTDLVSLDVLEIICNFSLGDAKAKALHNTASVMLASKKIPPIYAATVPTFPGLISSIPSQQISCVPPIMSLPPSSTLDLQVPLSVPAPAPVPVQVTVPQAVLVPDPAPVPHVTWDLKHPFSLHFSLPFPLLSPNPLPH